jgi:hypothetical protein
MLPATLIAAIDNILTLKLEPSTTMAIVGAILTPLLADAQRGPPRTRRSQSQPRRAAKRASKPKRRVAAAPEPRDAPRQRAIAALKTNPDKPILAIAKIARCARSTVVNAREAIAAEARKSEARNAPAQSPAKTEQRERAQRFLREQLSHGPKRVSDIEQAAEKARIDGHTLEAARAALGITPARANAPGNALSVQWSLPG